MKKLYILMVAILVTSFSYGQGSENFTNFTGVTSYADGSFEGNNAITWTYVESRDANGDTNNSGIALPALMLRRVSDNSKITSSTVSGGIANFSVKLYKGYTGGGNRQVELFINGTSYGTSTAFDDFNEHLFEVSGINVGGDFTIEITNTTAKQVIIDDITWTEFAGAPQPSIVVTAPSEGETINTGDVDVEFSVTNFDVGAADGTHDGHVKYTLDTEAAVMVYDTNPISFTGLSNGAHAVVMELVDDAGASLNPAVTTTRNFTVTLPIEVSNIAALRASAEDAVYTITGEVMVTFVQSHRSQKYIEDATGAILIDDTAGAITSTYAIGDGLTGLTGTLTHYQGSMQLKPSVDPGTASSTGNTLTPQSVTLATLIANTEDYESELVKITEAVTFADGGGTFATGQEYVINNNTRAEAFTMRTSFYDADYIGELIPTDPISDLTGILNERATGDYFITPRNMTEDMVLATSQQTIENFGLYPNPVSNGTLSITTQDNLEKTIQIFDVLGKQVFSQTTSATEINVARLNKGIYIIRVEEAGRLATRKLVIE